LETRELNYIIIAKLAAYQVEKIRLSSVQRGKQILAMKSPLGAQSQNLSSFLGIIIVDHVSAVTLLVVQLGREKGTRALKIKHFTKRVDFCRRPIAARARNCL